MSLLEKGLSVLVGNGAGTDRRISPGSKAQNPLGRHVVALASHQSQLGTPVAPQRGSVPVGVTNRTLVTPTRTKYFF